MVHLQLNNIAVNFGKIRAVDQVSLKLEYGQIGCLLGASGSGKSTLLRALAGFQGLNAGEILLHGECMSRPGWHVAPENRRIGMIFQGLALFPHLSVKDNIVFGMQDKTAHEKSLKCQELLMLMGLEGLSARFPHQLSGGQQQRVAIARALAPDPEILLMDEPFSSLDRGLREQLAGEIYTILKKARITTLLVTHDQMEAFAMSDIIGVMASGKLMQWGSAYDLYHTPVNRYIAGFVGEGVLLSGMQQESGCLETEIGTLEAPNNNKNVGLVDILIRPGDVSYDNDSPIRAEVCQCVFRGKDYLYTLKLQSGAKLLCLIPAQYKLFIGENIGIRVSTNTMPVFITPY